MKRWEGRRFLVEFDEPARLLEAVRRLREEGYRVPDAFVPYQVEELSEALGLTRTRIPWLVGTAAVVGAAAAYLLQWWISVEAFPLNVGGRPLHSGPAFVLITFEMAILFGSLTAFVALFLSGGMPKLWDPCFEVEGFHRATVDRYWLELVVGPEEEPDRGLLESLAALRVAEVPSEEEEG